VTAATAGYITVNSVTFHKQMNGRRTAVESKSNGSCIHRITFQLVAIPFAPACSSVYGQYALN